MAIGLSSARGDRRRRVLSEEIKATPTAGKTRGTAHSDTAEQGPRYEIGASPENHPQCSDFVPRRYRSLFGCFCAGAALITGVLSLSTYAQPWAASLGADSVAALATIGTGNLASWFSSITLGLAGALAILIFSLRRHRIDDYRGRYRVWMWAAAGSVLLSIDAVAPLHKIWVAGMTHLTGWTALPDGAAWWLIAAAVALLLFGVRAMIDLSESRIALTSALLAVACLSAAVATHLAWITWSSAATAQLVVAGATMSGHLLILITLLAYARHVILDAQGLLPVKPKRESERPEKSATNKSLRRQRKTDPTAGEPEVHRLNAKKSGSTDLAAENPRRGKAAAKATQSKSTEWVDGHEAEDDDYGDDHGGQRKLSKSARTRLRKQKARQQR
jgi:hypothetical protein